MQNEVNRYLIPYTYAIWSKDEEVRYNSTSGGAFFEFAKYAMERGGCVAGAKYNDENLVDHTIVDRFADISLIRQSKYMSSSIGDTYIEVKNELESGRIVVFSGAPCQVAGLYSYLGKDYSNLFTIDFICRGMNSPKAFKAWLNEIEEKEKSKAVKVWFKYKDRGWKSSPRRTRVDFENGTYKVYENENNLYMHVYLTSNLYIRPSCGECKFKGKRRYSDITLADFWGIKKEIDDDKGVSMLLINSDKGMEWFENIRNSFEYYEQDFDSIFAGNPMFSSSVMISPKEHGFLVDLEKMSFSNCLKKYNEYPNSTSIMLRILKKLKNL